MVDNEEQKSVWLVWKIRLAPFILVIILLRMPSRVKYPFRVSSKRLTARRKSTADFQAQIQRNYPAVWFVLVHAGSCNFEVNVAMATALVLAEIFQFWKLLGFIILLSAKREGMKGTCSKTCVLFKALI